MQHNLSQHDVKRAILSAKRSSMSDGWPILVEAIICGVVLSKCFDNALVGLLGFIVCFVLLGHRFFSSIMSFLVSGYVAYWVCSYINEKLPRFDLAVVVGIVAGFIVFCMHQYHARSISEMFEDQEDDDGDD